MDAAKRRKFAQAALVAILVLVLGIEFIGTVFSEKKEFSLSEKRTLAPLPEFHWTRESLQAYPEAFERFWKDHFLLRKQMVALNSFLRIWFFNRSPTFVVVPGRDRWFYMVGDWALQDYVGTIHMTPEGLSTWKHVIAQRQQWVSTWGGHYLLAIAPNKMMVYPENLPLRMRHNRGTTMLDAFNTYLLDSPLRENVLDLRGILQRAKVERQVYYKTDTHWNDYGAYQAYREIIRKVQQWYPEVVPLQFDRFRLETEFDKSGDLALLMGLPGIIKENVEEWTVISPCASPKNQPMTVPFLGKEQYPLKNGCKQGATQRILVISDSFGNYLRQYLSETFQEVVYDSSLELNEFEEFIAEYKPEIILHLHVGRFMDKAFVVDPELDSMLSKE
jgi:hypothetical protein